MLFKQTRELIIKVFRQTKCVHEIRHFNRVFQRVEPSHTHKHTHTHTHTHTRMHTHAHAHAHTQPESQRDAQQNNSAIYTNEDDLSPRILVCLHSHISPQRPLGHYSVRRVVLWAAGSGPMSSASCSSGGKDGCFGGNVEPSPRFKPKLRRHMLLSGAVRRPAGFTGAHLHAAGAISPGHVLRQSRRRTKVLWGMRACTPLHERCCYRASGLSASQLCYCVVSDMVVCLNLMCSCRTSVNRRKNRGW